MPLNGSGTIIYAIVCAWHACFVSILPTSRASLVNSDLLLFISKHCHCGAAADNDDFVTIVLHVWNSPPRFWLLFFSGFQKRKKKTAHRRNTVNEGRVFESHVFNMLVDFTRVFVEQCNFFERVSASYASAKNQIQQTKKKG